MTGRSLLLALAMFCAPSAAFAQAPALPDFAKEVKPVLEKYCNTCHGGATQMSSPRYAPRRGGMPVMLVTLRLGASPFTPGTGLAPP